MNARKHPRRKRSVGKALWFSGEEWRQVVDLMTSVGKTDFCKWARDMILHGKFVVNSRPVDARQVRSMLYRIGNNIN